jgi:hypothetical protein
VEAANGSGVYGATGRAHAAGSEALSSWLSD